jgi:hypothetical protein
LKTFEGTNCRTRRAVLRTKITREDLEVAG